MWKPSGNLGQQQPDAKAADVPQSMDVG